MRENYWELEENDVVISACIFCRHKYPGTAKCNAFKEGIPREILQGDNLHLEEFKGDGGIKFSPIDEENVPKRLRVRK